MVPHGSAKAGVELVHGRARLGEDALGHTHQVVIEPVQGEPYTIRADTDRARWMTAEQAVEYGLVDRILSPATVPVGLEG